MSRLKTCPGCHKGGFINLKSHKCKAITAKKVELHLVKPLSKKQLTETGENIWTVYSRIGVKTRAYQDEVLYDFVELGLHFMKVKDSLAHGEFEDFIRDHTDSAIRAARPGAKNETVSFLPPVSVRSAQNYMNAARNAGLTVDDDVGAVDKLRRAKALHGKKATELYRLTDGSGEEEEDQPTKWSMVRDAAVNFRDECERLIELRPSMSKKAFETVCARAQRTLEELTGSQWDMVKARKGEHFKEHGDIYEIGS